MSNNNTEYVKLAKRFACFGSIESLNTAVRQHLYNKKHLLTPSAITVLKTLARHATKFKGVAFLKIATIVELTGLSRSTVIRALNLLDRLGIVLKRHVMRPVSGGNGANVYVIQRYRSSDTPVMTPRPERETGNKTSPEPDKRGAETEITRSNEITDNLRMPPHLLTPYQRFRKLVESYQKDKNTVYKLYGIFLAQIKWLRGGYSMDELLNAGLLALRIAFSTAKTRKIRNLAGYYSGTLKRMLDGLYEETMTVG